MWGDESGSVNLFWFLQPSKGLFETKFTKQTASVPIFMPDISAHSELITFQNIPHIHNEPINRIMYEHHGELIITSSESTGNSVVIIDVHQKRQKYTWRIKKVLNIWDIPSQQCVKTIELKFPHFQAGGVLEHGTFPLLLSLTADPALLVTCREYLAMLRLHKTESKGKLYTCALYSPHLKQVITACADSSLAVWDVKTGLKKMEIRNAHGMEKISCITLDRSQRRLISAATNGTIKPVGTEDQPPYLLVFEAILHTDLLSHVALRTPVWLLFLQRRAQKNVSKNSAVLLSSQAGSVCWWSIYGPKHKHGKHNN
ncbi:hypothetical protein IRJ41_007475 [Triplophysa rosa]|uniref:Uncharacterized protein n=1 Tax=Triplophysa rosa TaxID=992332 RepID=A0A9W7TIX9_TRIRA|nr:hypothetical protein IRJ41_007475 [Triplophysa rosa]